MIVANVSAIKKMEILWSENIKKIYDLSEKIKKLKGNL